MQERKAVDPVCGKEVDALRARAVGIFGGTTFYFCSIDCKSKYQDPRLTPRAEVDSKPIALPQRPPPTPVIVAPVSQPLAPPPPRPVVPITSAQPTAVPAIEEPAERLDDPSSGRPRWALPAAGLLLALALYFVLSPSSGPVAEPVVEKAASLTAPAPVAAGDVPAPPTKSPDPSPAAPAPPQLAPAAPPAAAPRLREPPKPASPPESPGPLEPPLKLGLRRFVDAKNGHTDVSLKLLVVDAQDEARAFEVDRLEVSPDDPLASAPATAVTPHEDFVASSTRTGRIFDETLESGEERLEVRVTREEAALVVETRRTTLAGDNANGSGEGRWRTGLRLPVDAAAQVRAAPFARKRYSTAREAAE